MDMYLHNQVTSDNHLALLHKQWLLETMLIHIPLSKHRLQYTFTHLHNVHSPYLNKEIKKT